MRLRGWRRVEDEPTHKEWMTERSRRLMCDRWRYKVGPRGSKRSIGPSRTLRGSGIPRRIASGLAGLAASANMPDIGCSQISTPNIEHHLPNREAPI